MFLTTKLLRLKGSAFIVRSILVPLSFVTFRLVCSRSVKPLLVSPRPSTVSVICRVVLSV